MNRTSLSRLATCRIRSSPCTTLARPWVRRAVDCSEFLLARSAGVSQRRLVDRTGQPPSWETKNEDDAPHGIAQSANQPASVGPNSAENTSPPGEDLATKIRGILLRGDQQS